MLSTLGSTPYIRNEHHPRQEGDFKKYTENRILDKGGFNCTKKSALETYEERRRSKPLPLQPPAQKRPGSAGPKPTGRWHASFSRPSGLCEGPRLGRRTAGALLGYGAAGSEPSSLRQLHRARPSSPAAPPRRIPGSLKSSSPRNSRAGEREEGEIKRFTGTRAGDPDSPAGDSAEHPVGPGSGEPQPRRSAQMRSAQTLTRSRPTQGPQTDPAASSPRVVRCSPGGGARTCLQDAPTSHGITGSH
ncbi:uncharacterized protein [Saccopteryx leptura]|uniref:uncharacterized protein n=1 Tax=Saccopteryx leptura TaxID=249018 RepID=UPI00339C7A70